MCSTTNGKFSIANGEVITGVIVGLEPDGSVVHNVGLGTVNGVVMSFTKGVPGENASATKTGNTYQITGTAGGVDSAGQQIHKPFEVDATCPLERRWLIVGGNGWRQAGLYALGG